MNYIRIPWKEDIQLAKARVSGTGKLIKQLQEFSSEGAKLAAAEVEATAKDISAKAKKNAPANFGKLKQGIEPRPFMFPAWKQGGAKLEANLKKTLEVLTKRFNNAK